MRKHRKDEQEFLENIDRLIAGEEVSISDDADDDLRTSIEFSRRLSDIHSGPSVEFKEQLKSRLLMKLTEQEVAARQKTEQNWFWNALGKLIPQSPVWRTATITAVMLIAVVSVLWRTGLLTGSQGMEQQVLKGSAQTGEQVAAVEEEETEGMLAAEAPKMALSADESAPAPEAMEAMEAVIDFKVTPSGPIVSEYGTEVSYQLTFTNVTDKTVTITPFPPRITIIGDGILRPVRILPEGDKTIEVGPSGNITYILTWDQRDDNGDQVTPGWYTVVTGAVTTTGTGDTIYQGPWEFRISLQD